MDMDLNKTKLGKIKLLSELVWQNKVNAATIQNWISGISQACNLQYDYSESLLCALGNFIFFPDGLIREMLRVLYRDIYKKKIIEKVRDEAGVGFNREAIKEKLNDALNKTIFLGIGNPSESGSLMLYFFRQENGLSTNNFMGMDEAFTYEIDNGRTTIKLKSIDIDYYIFIDDFCGSGIQASERLSEYMSNLKHLNPHCYCAYYCLVGTLEGLVKIRDEAKLDAVEAVIELDSSFKVFDKESKILIDEEDVDRKIEFKNICDIFGQCFPKVPPYGFADGQQLIGFHHNTPDNTIPLFWLDDHCHLTPVFKRYNKM